MQFLAKSWPNKRLELLPLWVDPSPGKSWILHWSEYFKVLYHYRPQRSCGQGNIFTPVCHSVHRGGVLPQCMLGYQPPLSGSRHPPRTRHHPPGGEADSSIQSTSGRYASYWNAFLFINRFSSLSFQAVEAGFNTTEDFWVVVNEDLCLTCIIDQSSWLNARLLAVNLQIPNPDSRGCAPIDASLFRRLPTGMTVKKAVVTCSVIAKLLIASVELIYLCIVDHGCSTETLRCSRFFTIITPKI